MCSILIVVVWNLSIVTYLLMENKTTIKNKTREAEAISNIGLAPLHYIPIFCFVASMLLLYAFGSCRHNNTESTKEKVCCPCKIRK